MFFKWRHDYPPSHPMPQIPLYLNLVEFSLLKSVVVVRLWFPSLPGSKDEI